MNKIQLFEDEQGVYRLIEEEIGTAGEDGYVGAVQKKDYIECYICQVSNDADGMTEDPLGFVHVDCQE